MKQLLRKLICLNLALVLLLTLLPVPFAAENETETVVFYSQPASGTYRYGDSYNDLTAEIRSATADVTIKKIEWRNDAEEVLQEHTYTYSSSGQMVRDTLSLNRYGKITGPGVYGFYCLVTDSNDKTYASGRAVITVVENKTPASADECWIEIDGTAYYNLQGTQMAETWRLYPYWRNGKMVSCNVQLEGYQGGSIRTNIESLYIHADGECLIEAKDGSAGLEAGTQVSLQVNSGAVTVRGSAGQPAIRAGDSVGLSTKPDTSLRLYGGEGAHAAEVLYTSSRYYPPISARMPGDILAVGGGVAAYAMPRDQKPYSAKPTTELYLGDSEATLQRASEYDKNAIAVHLKQTTVTVQYYDKTASGEEYQKAGEQVNAYGQPAALTPPEPAVWDGYMFAGWADTQEPETYTTYYQTGSEYAFDADLSLYAMREEIVTDGATLTLDAGSGTIEGKNLPKTTLTAEKEEKDDGIYGEFTLPDVKPGSYDKTFLGWSENGELCAGELTGLYFAKQTVTLKSGTTLYAVYVESYAMNNKERCILLANGGATASGAPGYVLDLTAAAESRPEVKTLFTKDGFMLTGWNTQPDGSGASYGSDYIRYASALPGALYAQWEKRPASGVLYHGNGSDTFGGAAETVWVERPADGLADLGDQGFRRSYCTFLGWSTSPTGFPEEEIEVPEGELVELYAVWGFNAIATYGNFQWIAGPVQLGSESGATQTGASGSGWKYDSRVFLDESYPGGAIRTTNDLYLFVSGDVRAESITCGGTCFIEFADNASLTVTGADYGITAKQVQVGRFGKLTASGGTAAVSDTVQTTANLTECSKNQGDIKSGAENTVRTGADEASSRLTGRYNGEKWLRVEGKTIAVTYVNGSSRDKQTQKLLHAGVRIDRTPAPQDGRTFMGWALTSSGSGTYYYEGDTYAIPAAASSVTFYAQWSAAGDKMIYLSAGSGTVNGAGSTTMKPGADGRYRLPEAKGSTLFLGWMQVPYTGAFPGWNNLHAPEFDRSRDLIENNALLWPGESYDLKPGTALVAVWNKNNMGSGSYHVCKGNGGRTRADSPVALVHVYASDTNLLTYIGMEKEGYFLTGWRAENGGKLYEIGDAVNVGGQRFAAQWQSKQPGAAMLYGGLGRTSKKHSFLQTTELDASDAHGFAYAGYAFGGWYAHGETAPADKLEPGKAYLAHWKAYVVTYHDNGRTWTGVETVQKHELSLREDNTIFNGWNTKADGSGEWVAGGTPLTSDLALYAQYISISKDVLLYVSDGWFGGQNFQRIKPLDEDNTFDLPELLDGQKILTWCQYYVAYEDGNKYIRTTFREPGKQIMQPGTIARAILQDGKNLDKGTILLCGNGGHTADKEAYQIVSTASFANLVLLDKYAFTDTEKTQTGWNTQSDGTGTAFELSVPGQTVTKSGFHVLYAQWGTEEDGVWYSFFNRLIPSDYANAKWGLHGSKIQFPEPEYPKGVNVEFLGWRTDEDGEKLYQPGESYTLPEKEPYVYFTATWEIHETFTIDGKTYPYPTEMKKVFRDPSKSATMTGDGWELTVWDSGQTQLVLTAYRGGAIDFPLSLDISLSQETTAPTTVTGGDGQPAVSCGGRLTYQMHCTPGHVSAAFHGGSGAPAMQAKEIRIYEGAHLVLTGGGVPALDGKLSAGGVYTETLYGGSSSADLREYNSWQAAAKCTYLETRAKQYKMTVDGNGGATADGETTKIYTLYSCMHYYAANLFADFVRPGYFLFGYEDLDEGGSYPRMEPTITWFPSKNYNVKLHWIKTETDHTIAFFSGALKDADIDDGDFGLLLRDNTTPPTAPEASFKEPYDQDILICWEAGVHDDGPVRQYFPGELVYEPDNTILYPMEWAMRGSCLMLLVGNGKTFSDGRRIQSSETASATAADGMQPLSWNTKPDGSGTSYPVGWSMSVEEAEARTEPLYLYAQWEDSEAALPPIQTILPAITASAAPSAASAFADVARTDWFYADVQFVTDRGLMNGVGADGFAPNGTLTRAMIVTILHRLAKTPAAAAGAFTDVDADSYCADAVAWAAANGIVTGTKPGVFAPNANLTRGQLAAILYRFAVKLGYTAETQASAPFADVPRGSYYDAAVAWAVQSGIVTGMKADVFAPDALVTRAQAAAILHRFCKACSA